GHCRPQGVLRVAGGGGGGFDLRRRGFGWGAGCAALAPTPNASPAGLTRGSIVLRETFLRRRWIAGSSPAMTRADTVFDRDRWPTWRAAAITPPFARPHPPAKIACAALQAHGRGCARSSADRSRRGRYPAPRGGE